jgi:apolipoprotein N-acyltransferase
MPTLITVVLSGALWFASSGIYHVWPLAWIAPLPLLVALPDLRAGRAALAAYVAGVIGASSLAVAYRDALPPPTLAMFAMTTPLPFVAAALAWRAVARRTGPALATVAYPTLIVAEEYLVSLLSPNGTFGSTAYSQADVLPIVQIACVTGISGVTFVLSLLPAALAMTWRSRSHGAFGRAGPALAIVPLAAVLVFGLVRLSQPAASTRIEVGLAASDTAYRPFAHDSTTALPAVRTCARWGATLAAQGAQVVVLPEKFVGVTPAYDDSVRAALACAARRHHVTVVAGLNAIGAMPPHNLALVFGPDGRLVLTYDKIHMVPGLESAYVRGRETGLVPDAPTPTGVAICKDMDFVPLARAQARAGTGLLLVPAWDFVRDRWLHSRMALLRGIEGGCAIARCASNGLLTVSDARGRRLAERASNAAPEVMLAADVPVGPGGTFYSRTGDWFAWLCLAGALGCAVAAAVRK